MNIDELTLGQIKQLKSIACGIESNPSISNESSAHPFIGKDVIIRSYASGVHFGKLKYCVGKDIILENARRIWNWEGAFTLSAVSQEGVKTAKMSIGVPEFYCPDVCEIIPCSDKAIKQLSAMKEHRP